jgi:hypothetical protein
VGKHSQPISLFLQEFRKCVEGNHRTSDSQVGHEGCGEPSKNDNSGAVSRHTKDATGSSSQAGGLTWSIDVTNSSVRLIS